MTDKEFMDDIHAHWKCVVLCSECVHCRPHKGLDVPSWRVDCGYYGVPTETDGWCFRGKKYGSTDEGGENGK